MRHGEINFMKIALDGPSGAGKSTVAKEVAKRLGIVYVDTGALYRSIGLYVSRCGIDKNDKDGVISVLKDISVELAYENGVQKVILNGEDVSSQIRTNEISMYASAVSAIPEVRSFLLETQRKIARNNSVIMDGRDIGTVILPDAEVKIFLVASPEARAKRRYLELQAKGEDVSYEKVLADIKERDNNDSTREIAPAIPAEDAIFLDNSKINQEQTVKKVLKIIRKRMKKLRKRKRYKVAKFFLAWLFRFLLFLKRVNRKNEPKAPFIVCGNHTSALDPILLGSALKNQIHFIAKRSLFKVPVLGRIIRALGAEPVDRDGKDVMVIKTTIELLRNGECVGIFPQGTRQPGMIPRETEIKDGIGMIASRAKVGVLPVYISNKSRKLKMFRRNVLIIGDFIPYEEIEFPNLAGKEKYKAIAEYVFDKSCKLGEEYEAKHGKRK